MMVKLIRAQRRTVTGSKRGMLLMVELIEGDAEVVLAARRPDPTGLVEDAVNLKSMLWPAGSEKLEIAGEQFPVNRIGSADIP